MPKGPQGQKRPADTVANAIRVAKILTDEVEEDMGDSGKEKAAQALGKKGGAARREKLSPERRAEIARQAAAKRWGNLVNDFTLPLLAILIHADIELMID
jgi:hypothetical protein